MNEEDVALKNGVTNRYKLLILKRIRFFYEKSFDIRKLCKSQCFNMGKAGQFEIVDYFARSSFASAFINIPLQDTIDLDGISSLWQKKIVNRDFNKVFYKNILMYNFDFFW